MGVSVHCRAAVFRRYCRGQGVLVLLLATGTWLPLPVAAQAAPERPYRVTEERAPCRDYRPQKQLFWGDTHVHTAFSVDAGLQDTRNRPADAYRYARGERLGLQPYDEQGRPLRFSQLREPLDFTVVSDHAENLGMVAVCTTPGYQGYDSFTCTSFRKRPRLSYFFSAGMTLGSRYLAERYSWLGFLGKLTDPNRPPPALCGEDGRDCRQLRRARWRQIQEAAEAAYDRSPACSFTSFVGYEWTGNEAVNLHRNVIFRNRNVTERPISYMDESTPEKLWQALQSECLEAGKGCDVLAIPHNSNLSDGQMFRPWTGGAGDYSPGQARLRVRIEPMFEIMQHKGDAECWYGVGVRDEFCAFEKLPYDRFVGRFFRGLREHPEPRDGYARDILAQGMRYFRGIGVDPYQVGFIGSSDTHLGTPGAVEETGHQGHGGAGKMSFGEVQPGLPDDLEYNPGGLAAVWAEENTRDSLFAALRRREAYGTSGPRIRLRFFGGWNYDPQLCSRELRELVAQGYARGAPMGGVLEPAADGARPGFVVDAWRAAGGEDAPLQQLQIIKGWLDARGRAQEKIYTVAGDPDNGAGVDLATCRGRGSGYDRLCQVWQDPDFESGQQAYYYARVLQNPGCRWSAHICAAHQVDCKRPQTITEGLEGCCAREHRPVIQERAWSSPIWYRPAARAAH